MKTLLQGRNQTQYLLSPVAYFRAPFRPPGGLYSMVSAKIELSSPPRMMP